MSFPLIPPKIQFFDNSGNPLSTGTIEFRSPSTNLYTPSYPTADNADSQTNANSNPVILNSRGEAPAGIFLEDNVSYKVILKDSSGDTIWTIDDVKTPLSVANILASTYTPAGGTARTIQSKLDEWVTPGDFGGSLLTALSSGELEIYLPAGTYTQTGTVSVPANVKLRGAGIGKTIIKKAFNGTLMTLGGGACLEGMTLDGEGGTYTGVGIDIGTGNDQCLTDVWIADCNGYALEVSVINVGLRLKATRCFFGRTTSTNIAVKLPNGAETAGGRHFQDCSQQGYAFIDLGDSENTMIEGCNFSGITFNSDTQKCVIVGNRIPNTSDLTVNGSSHVITGNTFGSHNVFLHADCTNAVVQNNVIANTYVVYDASTGQGANINYVDEAHVITPTWGASTAPVIGNGSLFGRFSRHGKNVTLTIALTMGSTTTYGTGNWYFDLPAPFDKRIPAVATIGNVFAVDIGTTQSVGICRIYNNSGNVRVEMYNDSGRYTLTNPHTWASTDTLQLSVNYELG